jgi:hypothetical protein
MKPTTAIKAVDLLALKEALEGKGIGAITAIGNNSAEGEEQDHAKLKGPIAYLYFEISREAIDDVGYIVGTEWISGVVTLLNRQDLNIHDSDLPPASICRWVALPASLEVLHMGYPEESDTYYPPDDDMVWQELNSTLQAAIEELPEWDFDPGSKSWWLAGQEFPWK